MAARMAMIAMTTNNSIMVKPFLLINILFNTSLSFYFAPIFVSGLSGEGESGARTSPSFLNACLAPPLFIHSHKGRSAKPLGSYGLL
jgi:hypothetical protein